MSEEELRSRWLTHILHFTDWSHDRYNKEDNTNNSEDKEILA